MCFAGAVFGNAFKENEFVKLVGNVFCKLRLLEKALRERIL